MVRQLGNLYLIGKTSIVMSSISCRHMIPDDDSQPLKDTRNTQEKFNHVFTSFVMHLKPDWFFNVSTMYFENVTIHHIKAYIKIYHGYNESVLITTLQLCKTTPKYFWFPMYFIKKIITKIMINFNHNKGIQADFFDFTYLENHSIRERDYIPRE